MDKHRDPYGKAFSDSLDYADNIGSKIGRWVNLGGWKVITLVGTVLCILVFGSAQLIRSFGINIIKKNR